MVAEYLSSHDIVQCMGACKAFAFRFQPHLPRNVILRSSYLIPQSLVLNRHLIRSISVNILDHANLYTFARSLPDSQHREPCRSTTAFDQLRAICVNPDLDVLIRPTNPCHDHVLRILNGSPNLTHLTIPGDLLSREQSAQRLSNLFANQLPSVQHLTLQRGRIKFSTALSFLCVCFNHLQLATIHCYSIATESDVVSSVTLFLDALQEKTPGKPAMGGRIKSLILPHFDRGYPINFLLTLSTCLPNLERFQVPKICDGDHAIYDLKPFADVTAEACPKLRHIDFRMFSGEYGFYCIAMNIVIACKDRGLKSFRGPAFDATVYQSDSRGLLKMLVDYHFKTLEDVVLVASGNNPGQNLGDLLSKCRNLRRVTVEPGYRISPCIYFDEKDLEEWVCWDLKELRFVLTQSLSTQKGLEEQTARRNEGARKMYGQIGRLVKLETLCLGTKMGEGSTLEVGSESDLSLKSGWLSRLAGLKKLRNFGMGKGFWTRVGQAEVEFMDAQWPNLDRILFQVQEISEITKEPHWKWLQKRRPKLEFCQWRLQMMAQIESL
ncbi:hypothetical protein B0O80DRAFT_499157 [Mortierella sp. GBAus27b]|nr:hypothetical protein BGX31_006242 [Mortierella sp. GBA43]KAI8353081.1 hypothetical protein B0O80DRAFT_499157 [Mortierella sp. GBAus27b]